MNDPTIYGLAIPPIIIGVVRAMEMAGVPKRWLPILALIIGMMIGIIYYHAEWKQGIMIGIWYGLSAIGLHSGAKNVINGMIDREDRR